MNEHILKAYECYVKQRNEDDAIKLLKHLPKEKAYVVNLGKIKEGYLYFNDVVYAENVNKAKLLFLKNYDFIIDETNEDATYLTLPVIRNKYEDKYLIDGNYISFSTILELGEKHIHNKKLTEILNNPEVDFVYVKKGGYYYRDNGCGYSEYVRNAGVYKKEEGVRIGFNYTEFTIIPINIEEHNKMIQDEINYLNKKLICVNIE